MYDRTFYPLHLVQVDPHLGALQIYVWPLHGDHLARPKAGIEPELNHGPFVSSGRFENRGAFFGCGRMCHPPLIG